MSSKIAPAWELEMKCWSLAMSIKLYCFYLWWWNMIVMGLWPGLLSQIQITGTRCLYWIPDLYLCVINLYMIIEKGWSKLLFVCQTHKEDDRTRGAQRVKRDGSHSQSRPAISDRQQSKELWKEEVSSTVLPPPHPSQTFLRLTAIWSLKSDHWCPLSLEVKTGAREHF